MLDCKIEMKSSELYGVAIFFFYCDLLLGNHSKIDYLDISADLITSLNLVHRLLCPESGNIDVLLERNNFS